MIAKLLALVVGVLLGGSILGITIGLVGSGLVLLVFIATLLVRRDWVPVVYNLRSLTVRKVTTAVTVIGLALVTCVFATVMMLAQSVHATLVSTGQADNAKIIRKGSQSEVQSGLLPDLVRLLSSGPEVAPGKDGHPLFSGESVVLIFALHDPPKNEQDGNNVTVRGVGAGALELHSGVKLADGRMFTPGTSEIVVGKSLIGRFEGLRLGSAARFARRDWKVVGVLDGGGTGFDSEIWGDVDQMLDAFQRRPAVSSVTLRLRDAAALHELEARVAADPQLAQLEVYGEQAYYEKQSTMLAGFVSGLGTFVAIIFAFGAVLGAMITMYAQVAARTREIGTLRALGFRRRAVLVSFVVESVLLALVAAALGLGGASLMQLGSFSTMNFTSFSEVTFRFHLTPSVIVSSVLFAAVMGYAGGLLPALRAARMPITTATRGG